MKKDLPVVKVGQIWKDNDKRVGVRTLRVIDIVEGRAIVLSRGRTTRIKLDRFNPNRQTGYTLVVDA